MSMTSCPERHETFSGRLDALFRACVVTGENVVKQPRVTAAPGVDGLLHIPHLKERALVTGVLHGLVDEVLNDGPLDVVRVLKLVEQPVVVARVEAVVDAQARLLTRHLREHRPRHAGGELMSGEDQLHVLKRQPSAPPHLARPRLLIEVQHGPHALRALQPCAQLAADDVA
jgi:hypothetical protein